MIKIVKILKKIFISKFRLSLPKKKDLIVFDDVTKYVLEFIISDYKYFILQTRFENVNIFYINPIILFKTVINYKNNFWTAYLISLIQIVSPKVVITYIDNSMKFYDIANTMHKKIKFCAIQGGARYQLKHSKFLFENGFKKEDENSEIYIPNFFCFGKFESKDYKKYKVKVFNFIPVGSLRLENFLIKNRDNKKNNSMPNYDFCYISDASILGQDSEWGIKNLEQGMANFVKYIIKYNKDRNIKFICSLKRLVSTKDQLENELSFFRKYLNEEELIFLLKNSTINFKKSPYLSYELMTQSKLTVSCYSTMLRENIALGNKVLSVNLMPNNIYDFPLNGICSLNRCTYTEFEQRVDEIYRLSKEEYLTKIDGNPKELMEFNKSSSAIDKIKNTLDNFISD